MMDQILDRCHGAIVMVDDIYAHGKNDAEHNQCLCNFMHIAYSHGLFLNPKKSVVKATPVTFSYVFMMHKRSLQPCLGQYHSCHAPTKICKTAQGVLGDDHVFVTLHPITLNAYHYPVTVAYERC